MEWLAKHSDSLSVLTSFGTLFLWFVYAQLLYKGYRRQRQPRLIINRGKKKDMNALCIISNMSAEPIFLEYIVAKLETSKGTITMDVTDYEQDYDNRGNVVDPDKRKSDGEPHPVPERVRDNTRQGPLQPGEYLHIGTFHNIIRRLAKTENVELDGHRPIGDMEFRRLTLQLIGVYGPEDLPMGAERSFRLDAQDRHCDLTPETWHTEHKNTRFQRIKLRNKLIRLNESNFSVSSTIRQPRS